MPLIRQRRDDDDDATEDEGEEADDDDDDEVPMPAPAAPARSGPFDDLVDDDDAYDEDKQRTAAQAVQDMFDKAEARGKPPPPPPIPDIRSLEGEIDHMAISRGHFLSIDEILVGQPHEPVPSPWSTLTRSVLQILSELRFSIQQGYSIKKHVEATKPFPVRSTFDQLMRTKEFHTDQINPDVISAMEMVDEDMGTPGHPTKGSIAVRNMLDNYDAAFREKMTTIGGGSFIPFPHKIIEPNGELGKLYRTLVDAIDGSEDIWKEYDHVMDGTFGHLSGEFTATYNTVAKKPFAQFVRSNSVVRLEDIRHSEKNFQDRMRQQRACNLDTLRIMLLVGGYSRPHQLHQGRALASILDFNLSNEIMAMARLSEHLQKGLLSPNEWNKKTWRDAVIGNTSVFFEVVGVPRDNVLQMEEVVDSIDNTLYMAVALVLVEDFVGRLRLLEAHLHKDKLFARWVMEHHAPWIKGTTLQGWGGQGPAFGKGYERDAAKRDAAEWSAEVMWKEVFLNVFGDPLMAVKLPWRGHTADLVLNEDGELEVPDGPWGCGLIAADAETTRVFPFRDEHQPVHRWRAKGKLDYYLPNSYWTQRPGRPGKTVPEIPALFNLDGKRDQTWLNDPEYDDDQPVRWTSLPGEEMHVRPLSRSMPLRNRSDRRSVVHHLMQAYKDANIQGMADLIPDFKGNAWAMNRDDDKDGPQVYLFTVPTVEQARGPGIGNHTPKEFVDLVRRQVSSRSRDDGLDGVI